MNSRPVTIKFSGEFNNEIFTDDYNERNDPAMAFTKPSYEKHSKEDLFQSLSSHIYSDASF